MHIYKTTSFMAIILAFALFLSACAERKQRAVQPPPAPAPTTSARENSDEAAERRLRADQATASVAPAPSATKKDPEPKKVKSALELSCESYNDPHDKAFCYTAQSNELKKKAEVAKKIAKASEPESMKKVRERDKKAEKHERDAVKYHAEMRRRADIKGCDPESVIVHAQAETDNYGGVAAAISVSNPHTYPISINRPERGDIVENLGAGCRMKMFIRLQENEGDNVNLTLKAHAIATDGTFMESNEFSVSMSRSTAPYTIITSRHWTVDLHRVLASR